MVEQPELLQAVNVMYGLQIMLW